MTLSQKVNNPNSTIYDPGALRRRVIEVYGYERFRERLGHHLDQFLARDTAVLPVAI